MIPPIFATVYADATVRSYIGSGPCRFYHWGEAPENVALPYVTWYLIGGAPENAFNQAPDTDNYSTQIDVWANNGSDARAVAQAIRDAIEPAAHITRWGPTGRDQDTRHYRYSFDADWINYR